MLKKGEGNTAIVMLAWLHGFGLLAQHANGGTPYWGMAWDAGLWESIAMGQGHSWTYWLAEIAPAMVSACNAIGVVLIVSWLASFLIPQKHTGIIKLAKLWALLLSIWMLVGFMWSWSDRGYAWPYLVENTLRIILPWLLFHWHIAGFKRNGLSFYIAIAAIALTFLGHGWYAMGLVPVPGSFLHMTHESLGLSEAGSRTFLIIAGGLDMLVVLLVWFQKLRRPMLIYAAAWGIITALARITGNCYLDFPLDCLVDWFPEMLVRLCHGLVPLLIISLVEKTHESSKY
ncbi:MAG: hypothetical protein AB8F95_01115 [Bacteroidia bacterium]